jgi:hypothetical protein
MPQHAHRRGLAIRAGDADELKVTDRACIKCRRGVRGGSPAIGHDDCRERRSRWILNDRNRRPRRHCAIEKVMAVALGSANGDEEITRSYGSAVVGDPGNGSWKVPAAFDKKARVIERLKDRVCISPHSIQDGSNSI